ncbi:MAG TPA: TAXI family TRAP transporter solute-binding subunit [Desulfotomaculum sp.]|nr:TAXI family TRAP transporter solute-binding subunit [Desulfotomaculum sp.]
MKKVGIWIIILIFLLSLAGLSGCGSGSGKPATHLTFATAGTGGTFYPLGGGMAKIITKYVPNTQVTAEATGGSVENARLLDKGEADLAFVAGDVTYEAYNGLGDFQNNKKKIASLFATYSEPVHIVTLEDKPINSVLDLKGKKVAVGSPGSGTEVKARALLNALGITYNDIDEQFLSFSEASDALKDNNIDAAIMAVGAPASAVMDLSAVRKVKLISLTPEQISKVKEKYPYFTESKIKKGIYEKIPKEADTVAVPIVVAARADLPEQTAYDVVKAIFEHLPELEAVHNVAREITLQTAVPAVIPLHPGAEKYFKEKGLTWK